MHKSRWVKLVGMPINSRDFSYGIALGRSTAHSAAYFQEKIDIRLRLDCRGSVVDSNMDMRRRREDAWLARRRSMRHSPGEERVSRLRRRDAKELRVRGRKSAASFRRRRALRLFVSPAQCRRKLHRACQKRSQRQRLGIFEKAPSNRHGNG
jgi:hypothetical protein